MKNFIQFKKQNFFPISKKRRDTSSSTGSTSTTKKTKLNSIYTYIRINIKYLLIFIVADSHKSSTDASNAENSDSSSYFDSKIIFIYKNNLFR